MTFFRVLEAWYRCDFRKMEALKVNTFWMNLSHCNTGGSRSHCEELLFFNLYVNVQLVKRDIVITFIYYYIMTKFHYVKDDSAYGGVVYGESIK